MQLKNIGPGDAVQKNMLPLFSILSSVFSFQIFIFTCKNNKRLIIHIFLSIYHYKSYHFYLKRLCNSLCPNKNMKFVKVMFLHVSIILSSGGVSAPVHARMHIPPKGPEADPLGPEGGTPKEQCMLGGTGNKRAVCILLECILVTHCFLCVTRTTKVQLAEMSDSLRRRYSNRKKWQHVFFDFRVRP